jgi:hypothetical protein
MKEFKKDKNKPDASQNEREIIFVHRKGKKYKIFVSDLRRVYRLSR